ncbi:MAG: hypothetical protein WDO24_08125 [Pseudomonadota bacterium]
MFELHLGLIPGEAPIDRLAAEAIADPALASADDRATIVGDPVSGAVIAVIDREPSPAARAAAAPGLWHHLSMRWSSALATAAPVARGAPCLGPHHPTPW